MSLASVYPAYADRNYVQLPPAHHYERIKLRPPYLQASFIGEISPDWKFIEPFTVNIVLDEDGSYVISDDIFLNYGCGDNISNAINDFISSLKEFYMILQEGARTNPFDQVQFSHLQKYLQFNVARDNNALQTERN
jgi:hypothetical protein